MINGRAEGEFHRQRHPLRRLGAGPVGQLKLMQDTTFASPSAAAAVLLNRNSNCRTEWKVKDTGQTLKTGRTRS